MADGDYHRFNSVPRKIFDKHVDRMEVKRLRDREDHRADLQAIFQRLITVENHLSKLTLEVEELTSHVGSHCQQLDEDRDTEELE